jgi:VWFA-related protein
MMSAKVRLALMASMAFLLFPIPGAGQAPAQENQSPTIRTTTSEVLLDFVVRDKHANIIRDLKPGEVQVFEDGVPQSLRGFEFYDGRAEAQAPAAPATAAVNRPVPAAVASSNAPPTVNELRDISIVSIVIANLDPRDRALTVDAMRAFVKNELTPTTYVGVFWLGMGGLHLVQPYTNDGELISAAIVKSATSVRTMQFEGVGLATVLEDQSPVTAAEGFYPAGAPGPTGPLASYAMPSGWLDTWGPMLQDVYQTSIGILSPLHELVSAQASIPGRKVLVLFMSGLPMTGDTPEVLKAVESAANRANVTIYAFTSQPGYGYNDAARKAIGAAAGASMQEQLAHSSGASMTVNPTEAESLEIADYSILSNSTGNLAGLTEATGGSLLRSSNNMIDPLHEAMEGVKTHYELTYAPVNTAVDGAFRKIEVKVTRPGATVFARNGYYALPVLRGQQIYPFEMATLRAINTKPDLHQFDFRATTLEFRPGAVRNQFAFVFQAPTKDLTVTEEKDQAKVHVCVTALIKDSKGQIVDKISKDIAYDLPIAKKAEMQQGTVSFTTPFFLTPGHYTVDVASIDRQSMRASVSRSTLDVEQDTGFSMSDVALARRVDAINGSPNSLDPLQSRGATVTPELGNIVAADADGALAFYAVAYPQTPVDAPVNVSLEIDQDGKPVMKSPPSPVPLDANGAASILAKLPAGKLQPGGHYEADVTFQYKGERLMKKVDFTLAGGGVAANSK